MSLQITIESADLERIREKLNQNIHIPPAQRFIRRASQRIRAEVVTRTPVDTGNLRSRITITESDNGLTATVGTNVHYAPHVEFGTRPHWPPLSALQPWARRHGFPAGRRGAFLVARAIARRGTKARRMFQQGRDAAEPFVHLEAQELLREIGLEFRD